MRKDRLAQFQERLIEKHRQLADEVGRTALYGKDQEDDSIKDLGDQANTAYTREFFFELGNGNNRLLRDSSPRCRGSTTAPSATASAAARPSATSAWRRCRSRATASIAKRLTEQEERMGGRIAAHIPAVRPPHAADARPLLPQARSSPSATAPCVARARARAREW